MENEKSLNEIIESIAENERNLSQAYDKLVASLSKISNVFGNDNFCQTCGRSKTFHKDGEHEFKPKIYVSVDFIDDVAFYKLPHSDSDEEVREYKLAFYKGFLQVYVDGYFYDFNEISRDALKALIKSGRLISFLQKVSNELKEMNKEYKEVSEIAERIAAAL